MCGAAPVEHHVVSRRRVDILLRYGLSVQETGSIVQVKGNVGIHLLAVIRHPGAVQRVVRHGQGIHLAVRRHLRVQHLRIIGTGTLLFTFQEIVEEIDAVAPGEFRFRIVIADVFIQIQEGVLRHAAVILVPAEILRCVAEDIKDALRRLVQRDVLVRLEIAAQVPRHPPVLRADPDGRRVLVPARHIREHRHIARGRQDAPVARGPDQHAGKLRPGDLLGHVPRDPHDPGHADHLLPVREICGCIRIGIKGKCRSPRRNGHRRRKPPCQYSAHFSAHKMLLF